MVVCHDFAENVISFFINGNWFRPSLSKLSFAKNVVGGVKKLLLKNVFLMYQIF